MTLRDDIVAVEWAALEGDDDTVDFIGDYLLELWSDDEDHAIRYYRLLRGVLWAQETFYSAGAAAFPLLLRAAADRTLRLRQLPLKLAANVLAGGYLVHQTSGLDLADPVVAKRYRGGHARTIYDHALAQYDVLASFLDDDDDVAAHGALLLAFLSERREASLARLLARADGPRDEEARAAIVYATGLLLRYGGDPVRTAATLGPLEERAEGEFERSVAHAARYLTPGVPVHLDAGPRLASLVRRGDGSNATFMWADGYTPRLAVDPLLVQGRAGFDTAADMLSALVRAPEGPGDALYEYLLLHFVRHRESGGPGPPPVYLPPGPMRGGLLGPDELSAHEREALLAIADLSLDEPAFLHFALPGRARERRMLLGLEPRGVMEREVALDGKQMPVWKALSILVPSAKYTGQRDRPFLEAAFGDNPPGLAEVYAERELGAYGLFAGAPDALYDAFDRAGVGVAPYARRVLDAAGGARPSSEAENLLLRAVAQTDGALPVRYEPFFSLSPPLSHGLRKFYARTQPLDVALEVFRAFAPASRERLLRNAQAELAATIEEGSKGLLDLDHAVAWFDRLHAFLFYLPDAPVPDVAQWLLAQLEARWFAQASKEIAARRASKTRLEEYKPDVDEAELRRTFAAFFAQHARTNPGLASVLAAYERERGRPLGDVAPRPVRRKRAGVAK
jgi:hypothetical protein